METEKIDSQNSEAKKTAVKNFIKKINKKEFFLVGFAIVAIGAFAVYGLYFRTSFLSIGDAKIKAEKFINNYLLSQGTKAEIKSIAQEGGLYKIILNAGGQDITAYISKDGKKFFPQVLDIAEIEKQKGANQAQTQTAEVPKSEVPEVELFVMSYCPYGIQMEKGILPVLGALGSKIKFTLKFVSYAMHGEKEIDENLRQYCIQKEQNDKLNNYLTCFLKSGDYASCLKSISIDNAELSTCVALTDTQFKIKEKLADQKNWGSTYPPFNVDKIDNEKYSVGGSPTLVVNGQVVQAQRDPASILKTICSGFENQPAECSAQLSSEQPAPGFGEGTASDSSSSGCVQ